MAERPAIASEFADLAAEITRGFERFVSLRMAGDLDGAAGVRADLHHRLDALLDHAEGFLDREAGAIAQAVARRRSGAN